MNVKRSVIVLGILLLVFLMVSFPVLFLYLSVIFIMLLAFLNLLAWFGCACEQLQALRQWLSRE